jgi:hypothetical protein
LHEAEYFTQVFSSSKRSVIMRRITHRPPGLQW